MGNAVLLLDDLQWSDRDTIEALPALAATGPLIVTIRPGGDAALRAVKQMHAIGEVIDLAPLTDAEVDELARRLMPHDHDGRAVTVARASGGNPLALEALAFAHTHAAVEHADTLRAVIEACPHDARVTLARIGLRDPGVTPETAGVSELVDRRLAEIGPADDVTVAAEIFAEIALASLDDPERTALHRRRAEAIDDPGEAALHWAAAGVRSEACAAARRAAAQAVTDASRAQFLTLAAENAPDETLWSSTRMAVLAWLDLGDLQATKPLVARLANHEPPTVSDAIDRELMRARFALEERQSRELLEITDATIETYGSAINAEQQVSLLVTRAAAKGELYDIPGAIADARAAVELGDEHGISVTKAGVILAAINMVIGDDRWRRDLSAVFRRAKRDGEYGTAFEAGRLSALARFFDGDVDGGLTACSDIIELAAQQNNHSWDRAARGIRAANLSMIELASPAVVDELRRLVDDPAMGGHRHPVCVLLAVAEGDLGNFARADELVQSAVDHAKRWRSKDLEGLLWARFEIAWNAGRLDECVEAAEDLLARSIPLDFGTPAAAVSIRWVEWERYGECSRDPRTVGHLPGATRLARRVACARTAVHARTRTRSRRGVSRGRRSPRPLPPPQCGALPMGGRRSVATRRRHRGRGATARRRGRNLRTTWPGATRPARRRLTAPIGCGSASTRGELCARQRRSHRARTRSAHVGAGGTLDGGDRRPTPRSALHRRLAHSQVDEAPGREQSPRSSPPCRPTRLNRATPPGGACRWCSSRPAPDLLPRPARPRGWRVSPSSMVGRSPMSRGISRTRVWWCAARSTTPWSRASWSTWWSVVQVPSWASMLDAMEERG